MAKREESNLGVGGDLNSIIGKGAMLTGDLEVKSSMRVDGHVKGNLKCGDTIIVGKDGKVEGEIVAKNAVIGGTVQGKIEATDRVVLEATAVFTGDLKAGKLVIDEGAVFDGQCSMKTGGKGQAAQPVVEEKGKQ